MIWVSICLLALAVLVGVPIWLAVTLGSLLAVYFVTGINPEVIPQILYDKVAVYELIAVPLFMLAGRFISAGGAARPMVNTLNSFMGHLPGGPAYVLIAACAVL